MNFLTARSSLVFTCRSNVLVCNSGMSAEMINFYCFLGQQRTPVKLFSPLFFFFFLNTTAVLCLLVYLLNFFRHNLNLFLLYLWYCQQFPDRYSVLSFLSNGPITRLQHLHYKNIFVYSQISNIH